MVFLEVLVPGVVNAERVLLPGVIHDFGVGGEATSEDLGTGLQKHWLKIIIY
jgi:hypothetical protein